MLRRFALALVLVVPAFACSASTTTGANPADGDASTDDGSEIRCFGDTPISSSGACPAGSQSQGCGYSMIDGCCVWMCPPDDDGPIANAAADTGADAGDAGVCPPNGGGGIPTLTFDEQLAYECERDAGPFSGVGVSTKECGGVIAIIVQNGVDGQTLYLYDPSTKAGLEVAGGHNGHNDCIASASGVPLATSCTYALGYDLANTGPFGFVEGCITDAAAAVDSGTDAGSADSGASDAADAAGE